MDRNGHRAYLSEVGNAYRDLGRLRYSADWPEWERAEVRILYQREALAEARRILADVEPTADIFNDGQYGAATRNPLSPQARLEKKLAESLTAFLAAPDPAAYLKARQ